MAGSGLLALIDDVASLGDDLAALADDVTVLADDVSTLTVAATKKTTGLVTDDMAVTAEQTLGLARDGETPVILRVARGSLFNKFVILAPGALLLDFVAPWAIGPVLMAGGLFLSYEGVEKILHKVMPHDDDGHGKEDPDMILAREDPEAFEDKRVSGAIRTDLILSAEIVALTLGEVTATPFLTKAAVLYGVSAIVTVGVYGLVLGLVKIDDAGLAMVKRGGSSKKAGKAILKAAPWLMKAIGWVGTVAMLMVGGHILLEHIPPVEHLVHDLVHGLPSMVQGVASVLADIALAAAFGLVLVGIGATGIPGRIWRTLRPGAEAH